MINPAIIAVGALLVVGSLVIPRKAWALPANAIKYADDITAAERIEQLPPSLLARLLYQESRYRDDIISGRLKSSAGAIGIAQIVPRWHPNVDPYNPRDSIFYAAGYLRDLYDQFGSWARALAAYNYGPGNLRKAINANGDNWIAVVPTETQNYVTQILGDVHV